MVTKIRSAEQASMSIEEFLSYYDAYIQQLTWGKFPRSRILTGLVELEIDEVVQLTRIKLWNILQHHTISHPKLYIRLVVQSQIVNMLRQRKRFILLCLDEEEESTAWINFFGPIWGAMDPAEEYEARNLIVSVVEETVKQALTFPARQQLAFLCLLKEQFGGEAYLSEIFEKWHIDFEQNLLATR